MENRIKAIFLTLVIQIGFAGLFFLGGLLDPLLMLYAAGIYFFVIGSYLIYCYLLVMYKEKPHVCSF